MMVTASTYKLLADLANAEGFVEALQFAERESVDVNGRVAALLEYSESRVAQLAERITADLTPPPAAPALYPPRLVAAEDRT